MIFLLKTDRTTRPKGLSCKFNPPKEQAKVLTSHPVLRNRDIDSGSGVKGSVGQVPLIRLCLKDINTPGRARIHQVSSRNTSLRLQG